MNLVYSTLDIEFGVRMVPIASFYLGATATTPASSTFNRPVSMSQASLPRSPTSPPPDHTSKASPSSYRASMPASSRVPETPSSNASAFINQPLSGKESHSSRQFEAPLEEREENPGLQTAKLEDISRAEKRKSRTGIMNKEFKFPVTSPTQETPLSPEENENSNNTLENQRSSQGNKHSQKPSALEVHAPPPIEKEPSFSNLSLAESTDDDVGPTVEVPLN